MRIKISSNTDFLKKSTLVGDKVSKYQNSYTQTKEMIKSTSDKG